MGLLYKDSYGRTLNIEWLHWIYVEVEVSQDLGDGQGILAVVWGLLDP